MIKKYLLILLCSTFLVASVKDIERKIVRNKQKIEEVKGDQKSLSTSIKRLASQIDAEEKYYNEILKVVNETNNELMLNKHKLSKAREKLIELKRKSKELKKEKKDIEKSVIDFLIERYAMTIGIEHSNQESLEEVVDKEVYMMILDNSKQEVLELNIDYLKVNRAIRKNEDKTLKLTKYINKQEEIQNKYGKLQAKQQASLDKLQQKHKSYQNNLQKVIDKQLELKSLLGNLNILKKKEIEKEKERIRKAKELARKKALAAKRKREAEAKRKKELAAKKAAQEAAKRRAASKTKKASLEKQMKIVSREELDEDIDIEVRKLGSSTKGIKISKYNGKKTIAPLKSYDITKKFGKYYDKVYKMELFNESISLKTKIKNAKVFSVLKGQVVYAKQNSGLLENVVIVKHRGNLHTIYSHLDKISPTLKVGKWIPKGYVVGRVNDELLFQVTKNSKYIDPLNLFK